MGSSSSAPLAVGRIQKAICRVVVALCIRDRESPNKLCVPLFDIPREGIMSSLVTSVDGRYLHCHSRRKSETLGVRCQLSGGLVLLTVTREG